MPSSHRTLENGSFGVSRAQTVTGSLGAMAARWVAVDVVTAKGGPGRATCCVSSTRHAQSFKDVGVKRDPKLIRALLPAIEAKTDAAL